MQTPVRRAGVRSFCAVRTCANTRSRAALCVQTMETAITWERFAKLREHVKAETHRAIREVTGRSGSVTSQPLARRGIDDLQMLHRAAILQPLAKAAAGVQFHAEVAGIVREGV